MRRATLGVNLAVTGERATPSAYSWSVDDARAAARRSRRTRASRRSTAWTCAATATDDDDFVVFALECEPSEREVCASSRATTCLRVYFNGQSRNVKFTGRLAICRVTTAR